MGKDDCDSAVTFTSFSRALVNKNKIIKYENVGLRGIILGDMNIILLRSVFVIVVWKC